MPQAWGLFLAMSYYAIRIPIFSVALLDGEVGGRLWGPGHPPCILLRCLQGSWLKTPWSRLFIKFSLGFFFFFFF